MSLKKKLTMGIATGALAVGMIGGGTYAYFNDVETSVNTFAAGTLDLTVNPIAIISVDNLKPGDKMLRAFKLENTGTLDIKEIILSTDYIYKQKEGQEDVDFGKHIMVNFLKSDGDNKINRSIEIFGGNGNSGGNNSGGNNGGGNNGGGNNGGGNNGGGNNGGGNNGGENNGGGNNGGENNGGVNNGGGNNGGENNGGGNNGGGNNGGVNNGGGNNGGGNNGNNNNVIASMTLYELKSMSPNAIKLLTGGIQAGGAKNFTVEFEFVDNGKNQNALQGASLELKWIFEAKQTAGTSK